MKKFAPEACAAIVDRLRFGVSFDDAATASGIRPPTALTWLKRGRKEKTGPYADFANAVADARANALPEPMDAGELLRVVSHAARKGSVQAMKLRWEMILADRSAAEAEGEQTPDPLAEFDELAERRGA